jgi:hypothetical protein
MRPRVFVSSVMEGFEEFRQAAKNGIIAAGGEPVLVEDFTALPISPRNACLDAVDSCDIYIAIVGNRGGWIAPSGKLVVEEEYEEARRRMLRILLFIQNIEKDDDVKGFITRLGDYVSGLFRPTFTTPDELQTEVERALKAIIHHHSIAKIGPSMIQDKLRVPYKFKLYDEACLRFVLGPERIEGVIDHVAIGSQEFIDQIFSLGHSAQVRLFSYERPKASDVRVNEIVVLQTDEARRQEGLDEVRLEITVGGMIIIDANVTGRVVRRPNHMDSNYYIYEDDLSAVLKNCFAFSNAFFNVKDPYLRYDRLLFNTSLSSIEYRSLVSQPPQGNTYSLARRIDDIVPAFDQPRLITRIELANPEKEIDRIIILFRRRLKSAE